MRMLDANAEDFTALHPGDGIYNLGHEGLQIGKAVGLGEHDDNGHPDRRQVLLMREIAVHRDEDIKLTQSLTQELPILQAGPALVTNRRDAVGPEFTG